MEKLLTAQQISDRLQFKLSTIRKWTHYGFIPFVKLGGLVRFKESKVEEWEKKRERKGRSADKLKL